MDIGQGYYGEEVNGIILTDSSKWNLREKFSELVELTDVARIKKLLEFEYGYLIDSVENTTKVEIITIPITHIIDSSTYMRKMNYDIVQSYKDHDITAVVMKDGVDRYHIIDGYHRYQAAKNKNYKTVDVIVLE